MENKTFHHRKMQQATCDFSYNATRESCNFGKLCRLLLDVGTDVLRDTFDSYVPPDELEGHLKANKSKLKKVPSLGGYAWKKLYPQQGTASSQHFDISLFYVLFRQTGILDAPPKNGWGSAIDPFDPSVAAKIEMIRQFRNDLYGHAQHACISDEEFAESWDKLSSAVVSLGGNKYKDDIAKLKVASLDPDTEERCRFDLVRWCLEETDRLKEMDQKMDYIKEMVEKLRANGGEKRLEAQLERLISTRGEDDMKYVETNAYYFIEEDLFQKGAVLIIGDPGEGKTATAWHLILKSIIRGHELIVADTVEEWNAKWDPNRKQIVFIDDCFGTSRGVPKMAEDWQRLNERLRGCINHRETLIIATVRRYIFKELQGYLSRLSMFGSHIDISSQELMLTPKDRMRIFGRHVGEKGSQLEKGSLNKIAFSRTPRFPLSCRLFASDEKFQRKGINFFMNPVSQLLQELWLLRKEDRIAFSFLVLLLLNDGQIETELLFTQKKDLPRPRNILECISYIFCSQSSTTPWILEKFESVKKARGLGPHMTLHEFYTVIDKLNGPYIELTDNGRYCKFVHESILETVGMIIGEEDIRFVITHCSVQFIQQHVRVHNLGLGSGDLVINLEEIHYKMLAKRFTDDVINGHLDLVFQNPSVKDLSFSACWCSYLSCLDRANMLKFSRSVDRRGFSLMYWAARAGNTCLAKYILDIQEPTFDCLHGACFGGNVEMVQMLLQKGVSLDNVDSGGSTPLLVACHTGDLNIVKLLLENGADANWEQQNFGTPLHFACWNENTELVQTLLENGAKANMVTNAGWPTIYFSGADGNTKVLQSLLRDGKLSNLQADTNWSPLHLASGRDNLDIINILLENGADVNLTTSRGRSALLCATQKGHHHVVNLLIKHGADVNLADDFGLTCLHRVAYDGFTLVTKVLLNCPNININAVSKAGYNSLHAACESGNIDMVKLLVQYNADVYCVGVNGKRPIDVARKKHNDAIVSYLQLVVKK